MFFNFKPNGRLSYLVLTLQHREEIAKEHLTRCIRRWHKSNLTTKKQQTTQPWKQHGIPLLQKNNLSKDVNVCFYFLEPQFCYESFSTGTFVWKLTSPTGKFRKKSWCLSLSPLRRYLSADLFLLTRPKVSKGYIVIMQTAHIFFQRTHGGQNNLTDSEPT